MSERLHQALTNNNLFSFWFLIYNFCGFLFRKFIICFFLGYSIKFRSANERTAQSRKLFLSEREILSFAAALDMGIEAEESQQRSKFILDGLSADTEYEVAVAAINTNGTGPHCEWTTGRTMDHELSGWLVGCGRLIFEYGSKIILPQRAFF